MKELINWYAQKTGITLPEEFISYMIDNGIISSINDKQSLDSFLLDNSGTHIKGNRIKFINSFKRNVNAPEPKKITKFKLKLDGGHKMKLIPIN